MSILINELTFKNYLKLKYVLFEANFINIDYIEKYINDRFVNKTKDKNAKKWILKTLKQFIINNPNQCETKMYPKNTVFAGMNMPQWTYNAIQSSDLYEFKQLTGDIEDDVNHIIDYFNSLPSNELTDIRMTLDQAIRKADEWFEEENKKASDAEDLNGIKTVYEFADGHKWVEVFSKQSIIREGKLMQHCVGKGDNYYEQVKGGQTIIYSLRDPNNQPHVTLEVSK